MIVADTRLNDETVSDTRPRKCTDQDLLPNPLSFFFLVFSFFLSMERKALLVLNLVLKLAGSGIFIFRLDAYFLW